MAYRTNLTKKEKKHIQDQIKIGISAHQIMSNYKISERTYYRIKSADLSGMEICNGTKYRSEYKTKYNEINIATLKFVDECATYGVPVMDFMIRNTAKEIANKFCLESFRASNGWFDHFKEKYGLKINKIQGDSKSADVEAALEFQNNFFDIVKGYEKKDIFNVDETGLYWKLLPEKTLITRNKKAIGLKKSKDRITILFGTSLLGEKLEPLIIGSRKNPRGFNHVKIDLLNLHYDFNENSWMTKIIFRNYLTKLNSKMAADQRKIIIFLDNFSGHKIDNFSNIELYFLPPNTTSLIQPMDQGIINIFKIYYRKSFLNYIISNGPAQIRHEIKTFKLMNAIELISLAWNKIEISSIEHCFSKIHNGKIHTTKIDDNNITNIINICTSLQESKVISDACNVSEYIIFDNFHNFKEHSADIILNNVLDSCVSRCEDTSKIKTTTKLMEKLKENLYESAPDMIPKFLEFQNASIECLNMKNIAECNK